MRDDVNNGQELEEEVYEIKAADEQRSDVKEPEEVVSSAEGEIKSEEESPEELREQLEAAQNLAAEYLDGWQRARAEFANAKRRLERDKAEAYITAAVDHAKNLLPIIDDFDRALEAVPPAIAEDNWFDGLILVRRKLQGILEGLRVEPIEAVGQPFDPNYHEALALLPAEEVESGTVIEELQVGYRLGERLIRPSLVNVAD